MLEGYLAVYLNLDKVIKHHPHRGRAEAETDEARFKLTDRQAEAHPQHAAARLAQARGACRSTREHDALTKEQKELKRLVGSDKLQAERLIEEIKEIDRRFGLKTPTRPAPHRIRHRAAPSYQKAEDFSPSRRWSRRSRSPSSVPRSCGCVR